MKKKSMIFLIVALVIGFAAVSTTLIINGVVGIATNPNNFVDGVVFDEESLKSTDGATVSLSESGRTITFTTQEMTSIDETATVFFKIKNYSQYNATLGNPAISCYFVNDHAVDAKVESTSTTNPYMELIIGNQLNGVTINASGGTSVESSVTVKQTKSFVGDTQEIKFQCEINANAGDSETPGIDRPNKLPKEVELVTDIDGDGRADIGDEIRVGTENFYVISRSNTELNALAKYNLNVGSNKNPDVTEGIQHETVKGNIESGTKYGNVAFSNENGWEYENNANIDLKQYDGPVKDALYGESGYEKYVQQTIANASVRLITKAELEGLGCSSNSCSSAQSWVYSTSYWTQSAVSDYDNRVWRLEASSNFLNGSFNYDYYFGVRPVITITLV